LYYLRSFLEARGYRVTVRDHSLGLFERIFSGPALERIFADAEAVLAGGPGKGMDRRTWQTARRFLSESGRWLRCIDRLLDFLRGRDREWGHSLALANGTVPGGPRFDACLDRLGGNPLPEEAPLLASTLLADLADFITRVLDPDFSLIRYGGGPGGGPESVKEGGPAPGSFAQVRSGLAGYVARTFYEPYLDEEWETLDTGGPLILGLSVPFPGSLTGALGCAASAKRRFGSRVTVIAGGGYVNTELRFLSDPAFFDYVDYLSFDRGYGSLDAILSALPASGPGPEGEGGPSPDQGPPERRVPPPRAQGMARGTAPLYKTMFRAAGGRIVADSAIAGPACPGLPDPDRARGTALDDQAALTVFPDYRGVDFSRYICPVDDLNPMHRLWTDGRWLKAYLAHGCYWAQCTFCDTTLDYIRSYRKPDPAALYRHLRDQADHTGVRGIHLVDEAAPPASLLRLALLNLADRGPPLSFWGNIRFEPAFTPDTAAILAAGGLTGVSGGIEVAAEAAFKRMHKGLSLDILVRCCAAFKEAGILIHAYLIYGYWDQDEQELIDSAEVLRQCFAEGLLDSAFWHPFVLTRHSGLYAAPPPGLNPILPPDSAPRFALNDLSFTGEARFRPYGEALDHLLARWTAGDTSSPVTSAFPFKVPPPAVAPRLVAELTGAYAADRDRERRAPPPPGGRVIFLGSRPLPWKGPGRTELRWHWRRREHRLPLGPAAAPLAQILEALSREPSPGQDLYARLSGLLGPAAPGAWNILREGGLAQFF
jgi:radical SAM superfamily enzyme YgiQ (UPF0313 family)